MRAGELAGLAALGAIGYSVWALYRWSAEVQGPQATLQERIGQTGTVLDDITLWYLRALGLSEYEAMTDEQARENAQRFLDRYKTGGLNSL